VAFEEVCFYSHQAWCCGHALLADLTPLKAVAGDLASARQIGSPLFDSVWRAMKRVGHERLGAGKVSATCINNNRRFGAEPNIKAIRRD
jgi:hypothetical protein